MYKIIITTSNQKDILRYISKTLILKNLSRCIHILDNMESFYIWKGNLEIENENLLLIKCHERHVNAIRDLILEVHNYDNPEIISCNFDIISSKYKNWFNKNIDS